MSDAKEHDRLKGLRGMFKGLGEAFADADRVLDEALAAADVAFDEIGASLDEGFAASAAKGNTRVSVSSRVRTHRLGDCDEEVLKTEDAVTIQLGVPGRKAGDVSVNLVDGLLTVSAPSAPPFNAVERKYRVDAKTDLSDVQASVHCGALTITILRDRIAAAHAGRVPVSEG